MKKKRAAALAAAAVFITGITAVPVSAEENSEDTVILFTNDIHCGADNNIGFDGLALYKREMEAQHEDVFLVDA
ncbi:MAG: bifunctional metallophosphatase/5'-nucleotidase, partial [Oscillospiraceae bacterium]|nr:bifunctional metallophosphatase/5'-nucleotidase [Oscillospiraceae bacterium]